MDEDFILNYYGIDVSSLEEYVFSISDDAAQAETIIIMKVKSTGDLEKPSPPWGGAVPFHKPPVCIIERCGEEHQKNVERFSPGIENQAESDDAAQAETIIIMKVKSTGDLETFTDCLQTILDDKKNEMENYIPEQFAIVEFFHENGTM